MATVVDLYLKNGGTVRVGHFMTVVRRPDGSPDPRCVDDKGVALPDGCINARVVAVAPATYEDRDGNPVDGYRITCDTGPSCCNPS